MFYVTFLLLAKEKIIETLRMKLKNISDGSLETMEGAGVVEEQLKAKVDELERFLRQKTDALQVHIYIYIYMCVCVCLYIYMYIYIYIYITYFI